MKSEKSQTADATTTDQSHDRGHDKVHPVGSGVGAAAGAAAGAAVGAVGGPVGTLVGAALGAVAGGLVGYGVAEGVNPTAEDAYWRENFRSRPYVNASRSYEEYQSAYRYGWESRSRYGAGHSFEDVEPLLERDWNQAKGASRQTWDEARNATRDAWHHAEHTLSGDPGRGHPSVGYGGPAVKTRGTRGGTSKERETTRLPEQAADASKNALLESGWDPEWDQIYPSHSRLGMLQVPLQELHDVRSGRLDTAKVAEYLDRPFKQMADAMGKSYSTVHKTPAASDVQPFLQSIKTSLVILEDVLANRSSVLAWLNSPHPDLGQKTPLDVILEGHPNAVKNMLQAAIIGTPS